MKLLFMKISKINFLFYPTLIIFTLPGITSLLFPKSNSLISSLANVSYVDNSSCANLESSISSLLGPKSSRFSVSILDHDGVEIVSINSLKPRVPASNQKILSSAYALERLGPKFLLTTDLNKLTNNTIEIIGNGDPDYDSYKIKQLAKFIKQFTNKNLPPDKTINIIVRDNSRTNWWPEGWNTEDKKESYGAPITQLAISSNESEYAISNPTSNFVNTLRRELSSIGVEADFVFGLNRQMPYRWPNSKPLYTQYSGPMNALLSLSNSQSHNFTSEVLLRKAANTWESKLASQKLTSWLKRNGISTVNLTIKDGSGLSRQNRLTTKTISDVLFYMLNHKYHAYYFSSMAIVGQRGTLKEFSEDKSLYGRFYGKTGTLDGVKSISGYLETPRGYYILSVISNGLPTPLSIIEKILLKTHNYSICMN